MSLLRPFLAVAAFAFLLAFYLWDVRHVERSRLINIQRQQVFFHDPTRVVELEFHNDGGTVRLMRTDAQTPWRVVDPAPMGANEPIILAWLENLRGARRQAEFATSDWEQYGLENPQTRVTLGLKDDRSQVVYTTLEFGSQPAAFGPVHARIRGEGTVFTVSEWFFRQARKQLADVRDRRIAGPEFTRMRRLEVRSARGTMTLTRENPTAVEWFTASAGRPIPADRVITERMMNLVSESQFIEVLDRPTSSTLELGLNPPFLTVLGDGETIFEVGLRIPGREQFVVRNAAGTIGIAGRSAVGEFFRPAAELTTKRMVWTPTEAIESVEISSGNSRAHLMRDRGGWIFPDMPGVPIRTEKVDAFLSALANTSAARYVRGDIGEDELTEFGIVPESYNLIVTDRSGSVQGLRFGRTDTTEGLTFVWRRQDRTLWRIDFTAQGRLFRFRRDFEERRIVPDLAARTARVQVDIGANQMLIERRGAAWQGTIPGESPVIVPPNVMAQFLDAFQELEVTSEMALMGSRVPAAVFQLYEPGAPEPFANIRLLARNRQSRAGLFEFDGRVIEVDAEQFDVFDEAMAALVVAIKEQAERYRAASTPRP